VIKAEFPVLLHQSSVSHDPSQIILKIILWHYKCFYYHFWSI